MLFANMIPQEIQLAIGLGIPIIIILLIMIYGVLKNIRSNMP